MNKVDLSALDNLLLEGKDFQLTDTQYEEKTGKALPKTKGYIKYSSPIAQRAKKQGFSVDVKEVSIIQRILVFTKK